MKVWLHENLNFVICNNKTQLSKIYLFSQQKVVLLTMSDKDDDGDLCRTSLPISSPGVYSWSHCLSEEKLLFLKFQQQQKITDGVAHKRDGLLEGEKIQERKSSLLSTCCDESIELHTDDVNIWDFKIEKSLSSRKLSSKISIISSFYQDLLRPTAFQTCQKNSPAQTATTETTLTNQTPTATIPPTNQTSTLIEIEKIPYQMLLKKSKDHYLSEVEI